MTFARHYTANAQEEDVSVTLNEVTFDGSITVTPTPRGGDVGVVGDVETYEFSTNPMSDVVTSSGVMCTRIDVRRKETDARFTVFTTLFSISDEYPSGQVNLRDPVKLIGGDFDREIWSYYIRSIDDCVNESRRRS